MTSTEDSATTRPAKEPRIPLDQAMERFGIPLENRTFIRDFAARVGITGCTVRGSYIKAYRADRGRPLHIAPGWTNGFTSREEAKSAVGDGVDTWEDDARGGLWGVSHPRNWIGPGGGGRAKHQERDFGMCPVHFQALPATGVCDLCE